MFMTFGQVVENLMAAVKSANVPFCVVLVDPWVEGLGAPMFELDLQKVALVSDCYRRWGLLLPFVLCNCLLYHVHGLSGGSRQERGLCMC